MDQMPRLASTFINVVSAKGTIINVKITMVIYKCRSHCKHDIYKFWAAAARVRETAFLELDTLDAVY